MIVANQKKQENIIEYVLYMWQIEDLIRANNVSMANIDKNIIPSYNQSEDTLLEIRDWWANLTEMMQLENKQSSGHLQINTNTVNDINHLHMKLMKAPNEVTYQHLFNSVLPTIREFDQKSGQKLSNDIEICLTAIYSTFLLKLKKQEVSPQTDLAVKSISKFLATLAKKYKQDEMGKLEL
ncbi:DUF4924 family protein [Carboxylicivirga linearis]|uniref:DUF4924 family protein n=1 Tax=Carboxylicivirga linearis TaxID=1628157 RepID=A0ABS5JQP8_9BACT|nr:DUF4924 family protein [Carboxylicivirga linearis]MBS2097119.1 DUF4924 family protein [Carboxylicivirga linearis]